MELSHKTHVKDFRTINPEKFKLFVNGKAYKIFIIFFNQISFHQVYFFFFLIHLFAHDKTKLFRSHTYLKIIQTSI